MKIFTGEQIGALDRHTAERENIDSWELMERAAEALSARLCNEVEQGTPLLFFAGKGNNGGDALAMARMMYGAGFGCTVYMPFGRESLTPECRENLDRLPSEIRLCRPGDSLEIPAECTVVDGLLGSGARGSVRSPLRELIEEINGLPNRVISIDIPSGMAAEFDRGDGAIVNADVTLTVEYPKLSMLMPSAGEHCGRIEIVDIGLDEEYKHTLATPYHYTDENLIRSLISPRSKFAHKGTYGHALLVCGSEGMCGAAILAAGAALRSGCGLVTAHIPRSERFAMVASHPSAILSLDPDSCFSSMPENIGRYSAVCAGCGLGQAGQTREALALLLDALSRQGIPMVLDADALNIIAAVPSLRSRIPAGSILTPHIGELRRLTGEWADDRDKIEMVRSLASETDSTVIVKGAHTMVCFSDGRIWFNSTGNSGMAKGGSGDVLAGLLCGLMARGYTGRRAALIGVWLHGLAGDKAADYYGREAMNSGDLTDFLAEAAMQIQE